MRCQQTHDLLTWPVAYATSMHCRLSVGRDGKTADERSVWRRAVPPLAQFCERASWMPLQPSNRRLGPLDSRFEQRVNLGPMDGSSAVLVGAANGVVKARTVKRSGSEHLCCNHTRQFLHHHCCLNFDRCDERHHAEPISNSLGAQTVALGVPTQELVVHKRSIVQNRVVPAWRQSWRQPLKGFCDWSEPGSVLLSLPRNRVVAMRAKEEQPRAPPASRVLESGICCNNQEGGSSSSGPAMPASDSPPLEKRGLG